MTERQQFQRALSLLHGIWLPNAPGHKGSTVALSYLFETLNAPEWRNDTSLDGEHRRWVYEWACDQWEDMPSRGATPPLEP